MDERPAAELIGGLRRELAALRKDVADFPEPRRKTLRYGLDQIAALVEDLVKAQTLKPFDDRRHVASSGGPLSKESGNATETARQGGALREEVDRRREERDRLTAELRELRREAKRLTRSLERAIYSEAKYRTMVENSLTGIFIYRDQKIVFANSQFARLLGYPQSEILGIDPGRLFHPDEPLVALETGMRRPNGGHEVQMVTKAGEALWVLLKDVTLFYRGKRSTLGNIQDVTRLKRVEESLRRSKEELHRLSGRILTAQEEERARVAHELHDLVLQPLCGVKFYAEGFLAGRSGTRGPSRDALQSVVSQLQSSIETIRGISTALRPASLGELGVLKTVSAHCQRFQAAHPGIRVETKLAARERDIPESVRVPLYRVLQEALADAAQRDGTQWVVVTISPKADGVELAVVDDGGLGGQASDAEPNSLPRLGTGTMRERVEFSGGCFRMRCATRSGTLVRASWPSRPDRPSR